MKGPKERHFNLNINNHSNCTRGSKPCLGLSPLMTYLSLICILGVVSNVMLLYSDYKGWKKRKTPDKILICNIIIANMVALLISLPFQTVHVSLASEPCDKRPTTPMITVQKYSFFMCTLASSATLGVLGIDRLDALTKFAHQRKLTIKSAVIASVLVWVCSLFTLLTSSLLDINMPFILPIWITISCAVIVISLLLTTRKIRKHRQDLAQMFQARHLRAEIKFTKTVYALCFCFAVFILPHLIVTFRVFPRSHTHKCALSLTTILSYLSFALLPVAYFAMDPRMLSSVLPKPLPSSTFSNATSIVKDTTNPKKQDHPTTGSTHPKKQEQPTTGSTHPKKQDHPTTGPTYPKKQDQPTTGPTHPKKQDQPTTGPTHPKKQDHPTTGSTHPKEQDQPTTGPTHPKKQDQPTTGSTHPKKQDHPTTGSTHLKKQDQSKIIQNMTENNSIAIKEEIALGIGGNIS